MMEFFEAHKTLTVIIIVLAVLSVLFFIFINKKRKAKTAAALTTSDTQVAWYANPKHHTYVIGIIFTLLVIVYGFNGIFWDRALANGPLFIGAIIFGIIFLFRAKHNKAWIAAGIVVLLLTGGKYMVRNKKSSEGVVKPFEKTIALSHTDTFRFPLGPNMYAYPLPVKTGMLWWKHESELYFQTPSGKIFQVNEEGVTTPIVSGVVDSANNIRGGTFLVWGKGKGHIKTGYLSSL